MDIMLSADQKRFKDECRIFAVKQIGPLAEKYGETDQVPDELIRAMDSSFFNSRGGATRNMPLLP